MLVINFLLTKYAFHWHAISDWPSTVAPTLALCAAHGLGRTGLRMHMMLSS